MSYYVTVGKRDITKRRGFFPLLQLKEMFRRELEKAEQQVRRSSGIIADYKQVQTRATGMATVLHRRDT